MKCCSLAFSLLSLGLTGCEHFRTNEGTVRDSTTHRRVDAAKYQALLGDARDSAYDLTNRTGRLHVTIMRGTDQDLVVRLTKPGYDTLLLKIHPIVSFT